MRAERTAHRIAQRRVGTIELTLNIEGEPVCSLVTAYDIRDLIDTKERTKHFVQMNGNILSGISEPNNLNRNEVSNTDTYKARGMAFI